MQPRSQIRTFPVRLAASLHSILLAALLPDKPDRERGDVPGWVMITLMSAVLVAAILAVAQEQLLTLFRSAIDQVRR
ncbi:hypothetical protein H9638_10430 [Arthrobacter sp. Sa2BUA2]|uniref:Uncharacterized protein n=1 Tax=Arthrobacter pullicola TaxID=2762224 RepID=A0ABR8YJ10_9MICC|nr:hypothetical protein [Arthrobacter pullicola]MBD8044222.1 hypothetical protein [Arthrobacter pullicola]